MYRKFCSELSFENYCRGVHCSAQVRYKFSNLRFIDTVYKKLSSELTFANYYCGVHYSADVQV